MTKFDYTGYEDAIKYFPIVHKDKETIYDGAEKKKVPYPEELRLKALKLHKAILKDKLRKHLDIEIETYANISNTEKLTWILQENEAREWIVNRNVETPLIDSILEEREGITKQMMVDKILTKAAKYKKDVGNLLGKHQRLIKRIDACTTLEQLKKINYPEGVSLISFNDIPD